MRRLTGHGVAPVAQELPVACPRRHAPSSRRVLTQPWISAPICSTVDRVEPHLTLVGLRLAFELLSGGGVVG